MTKKQISQCNNGHICQNMLTILEILERITTVEEQVKSLYHTNENIDTALRDISKKTDRLIEKTAKQMGMSALISSVFTGLVVGVGITTISELF